MAYVPTQWNTGDPITQERMNKIENGITSVTNTAETAESIATSAATNAAEAKTKADQALSQVNSQAIQQNMVNGNNAWAQVKVAVGYNDQDGSITQSLNERFVSIENTHESLDSDISQLRTEVQNARRNKASLLLKITEIDEKIAQNSGNITDLENAKGVYNTLRERLNAEDEEINNMQVELNNAHKSTIWNKTTESTAFESLDARLEYNEDKIKTSNTNLENISSTKINYSDVVADLQTNNNMLLQHLKVEN